MPPQGLAILLGAGPVTGSGIARILAHPSHGNLAVALLSRSISPDSPVLSSLHASLPSETTKYVLPFQTDIAKPGSLAATFERIKKTPAFEGLALKLAIFNVKHAHRTPFLDETREQLERSLTAYVGGATEFAQEAIRWMLEQSPPSTNSSGSTEQLTKKGTLIFTGTLGALRTNTGYAAYGAGRSSVRMLAQSLAREFSSQGVQVVHAIANGGITDVSAVSGNSEGGGGKGSEEDKVKVVKGEKMRAESVGKLYLSLMGQEVDLWVHELDMRPAAEKF